jgi:hypothetical protein
LLNPAFAGDVSVIDKHQPNNFFREEWKRRVRSAKEDIYVRAVGIPHRVEGEQADDPSRVDHVWLSLDVAPIGKINVAINTMSRYNRDAGFDERIRLGILPSTYSRRPERLLESRAPLDYTVIEAMNTIDFVPIEHDPIEALLIDKCNSAIRAEVWGELYIRQHLGIHQVHSRRASCAVERDIIGRDGALKLYYRDGLAELLMFKFCGQ